MTEWQYSTSTTYSDWDFMYNNADCIYGYLSEQGWSVNAVAACCGNLSIESGINPWSSGSGGYGLGGWTPTQNLIDWAARYGYDYTTGPSQILLINTGVAVGGGATGAPGTSMWGISYDPHSPNPGGEPVISWEEFKTSNLSADTLASYYMYYWEKPAYDPDINKVESRKANALTFLSHFEDEPVPPSPPSPEDLWVLLAGRYLSNLRRT